MNKLFSYGTLQQENVQKATFGRVLDATDDAILGYTLSMIAIKDEAVVETSGKTHHPIVHPTEEKQAQVAGKVLLITDAELAQADAYEVDDYKRVLADLASGGQAWVYVASVQ